MNKTFVKRKVSPLFPSLSPLGDRPGRIAQAGILACLSLCPPPLHFSLLPLKTWSFCDQLRLALKVTILLRVGIMGICPRIWQSELFLF